MLSGIDLQFLIRCFFLLGIGALIKFIFFKPKRKKAIVGYVKSIRVYPVKSTAPIYLNSAEATIIGLKHDRQFILINEYGTIMTLRKFPKLVLVQCKIKENGIELNAHGMQPLILPLAMKISDGSFTKSVNVFRLVTDGVHVSEEADKWFQEYLGVKGCQLFCYPSDGIPRFVEKKLVGKDDYVSDGLMFADGCPVLIASDSSADEINSKCETDVSLQRFRPNIEITGCKPFEEDTWGSIEIGNCSMYSLYPCQRCVAINIDPTNGTMDKSKTLLLKEMERIRPTPDKGFSQLPPKVPIFGYNYAIRKPGIIKVGDPVYHLVD